MNKEKFKPHKARQTHKQPAWKVSINNRGSTVIFPQPISYQQAIDYFNGRFPGYLIEVGV